MQPPGAKIAAFIQKHHVFTLATCRRDQPYSTPRFYLYRPERPAFIFLSDPKTRHVQELLQNRRVSGGIHLETEVVEQIQGLQFTGTVAELAGTSEREAYYARFPQARNIPTAFWELRPDFMKMTDNTVAFGFKEIWRQNEPAG